MQFFTYHLAVLNMRLHGKQIQFPFKNMTQTDQHYQAKSAMKVNFTFNGLLQCWGFLKLNIFF